MIFKRSMVAVLCSLLGALPALPEPQAAGGAQAAGEITAMIPAATLNSKAAKAKEELNWNDLIQTEHTGRVRAGLKDGSILSVGSDSELRIVQHDSAAQQTQLEMDFGKVRSQVVKITRPGGKFQVKTPNAVIGVVGTDFFVGYEADKTTVICYKGVVTVSPLGNAKVMNNSGQANAATNSITVSAGQMVVVTTEIPPSGFQASNTPPDVLQTSISDSAIDQSGGPGVHHGHTLRWVLVGTAVAVGLGLGIGLSQSGGGGKPPANRNPAP
jgi:ferric-dicitrate binding protein FerR (iron transport regulator)